MRPGGRVVVLEITTPTRPPLSLFYRLWFDRIVPALGRLAGALAEALVAARGIAAAGDDRRRLHLPAQLGQTLPGAGRARGGDGARGPRRHRLPAHGRRHRRHPRRHGSRRKGMMSTVVGQHSRRSPTGGVDGLDAIMRRGGRELRERMARTELHLERVTAQAGAPLASHANATIMAGGKRLRPLLVVLAAESAGGPPEHRRGRGAPGARSGRGRARALGDARPRRPDRRRPAAARPPHGGRGRRARARDRDRRPAVLAGVRRARAQRGRRTAARALAGQLGARRRRAAAARGRLRVARGGRALPEALRAEDGGAVRGRLPPGSAHGAWADRARSPRRSARSPGASGWPSRCSTTCSTCPARSSAPASRAGSDLLDGTVTLPLHPGARARAGAGRVRPQPRWSVPSRRRRCASGSPPRGRWTRPGSRLWRSSRRPRRRCRRSSRDGRSALLDMVADAVVERYR